MPLRTTTIPLLLLLSAVGQPLEAAGATAAVAGGRSTALVSVDKLHGTPDLLQTDPAASLPGGGRQYCAPVAVSNSLMWLGANGYPQLVPLLPGREAQYAVARILGSSGYMDTDLDHGTGVSGLLRGVRRYLDERDVGYRRLAYQGWRVHQRSHATGVAVPDLAWVKAGIHGAGAVWLNVGWYRHDDATGDYERIGGHWITLVGYGVDAEGRRDDGVLIVHDPGSRGLRTAHHVRCARIARGRLTGRMRNLPRDAAGFHRLAQGLPVPRAADCAILDGAVVLTLD